MDKKKYLIDGRPISARGIINTAKNSNYESPDGFYLTSECAAYLRELGYAIGENTDFKE